ncbi:hypothetical protein [uncultured Fibrobacter sp.]|uniref:hypothetical protein n=1 Tax=uncultured Fibrobacter sp. TaxID=261512 RepID=UPI0025D458E7|nr:hypothetical protein [uncultured Fibrobacter sp.]
MVETQEKIDDVSSDVKIDIDALEKELNDSEFSRGWEKGREDTIRNMQESLFPPSEQVLKVAEITFREMEKQFGKVFDHVYAGFNSSYDAPSVLFCLKPEASKLRAKICYFGVMLSNAIYNAGLVPLNVLVTKAESTDFDLVRHDFKFQRIMHA